MLDEPIRDRRSERRSATRQEILAAAWQIARRDGIAAVTLREVAAAVGMRAPSLYSHFPSKNAIFGAMFAESWQAMIEAVHGRPSADQSPRRTILAHAETYFDFATSDLARYQLMNQRTIPDFEPSDEEYAVALAAYDTMRAALAAHGITRQADLDLFTALLAGVCDQALANDPGGTRWRSQLPRVIDMFADEVGLAGPRLREAS